MTKKKSMARRLYELDNMVEVQRGLINYEKERDEYFRGMANGLIMAQSLMHDSKQPINIIHPLQMTFEEELRYLVTKAVRKVRKAGYKYFPYFGSPNETQPSEVCSPEEKIPLKII